MFSAATESITEFKCEPIGVLYGEYSHAQFDILEQAIEKIRKEKTAEEQSEKTTTPISKGGAELFQEKAAQEKQKSASLVIPYGTKVIPAKQYWDDKTIKKVVIPDTVETIGEEAFAYSGLEEIIIECKNCVIEKGAFGHCENLKKISIANNPGLEINYAFLEEGAPGWIRGSQVYAQVKLYQQLSKCVILQENTKVDFCGRRDFSKINDIALRYKAGRCIKCGGEFGFLGKCKNCKEKRI